MSACPVAYSRSERLRRSVTPASLAPGCLTTHITGVAPPFFFFVFFFFAAAVVNVAAVQLTCPDGPVGPGGPVAPVAPVLPDAPALPVAPSVPVAPWVPGAPAGPLAGP